MFLYYTAIIVLAIFSQAVMLVILKSDNLLPKENKRNFTLAFITFIMATFLEWYSDYVLKFTSHDIFYYTVLQAIMHIIIPLTPYYLGAAFKKFDNQKIFEKLFLLNILIQALSLTPCFFNNFHNIFAFGNTYILYFSIFLYTLYKMFTNVYQVSKSYQSGNITILIINIFIVTMFAIVLQSVADGINTIFIVNTANAIILYSYFSYLINKRDGLTFLLNRRCFTNTINSLKRNSTFISIDLNKFKEINDTHGHLVGDEILKEIASICLEVFQPYGNLYRIGGDEYFVIIKNHFEDIDMLITTLHENIANKRKTNPLLTSVSVGYSYFNYGENTVNDAINEADAMMYELKNKHESSESKLLEDGGQSNV